MKQNIYIYSCIFAILVPGISFAHDDPNSVPEPSTILFLGIAIIGLGIFLFWKSKKKK